MDDYSYRREARVETVAEAVARVQIKSHDPIDHSYRFDQEWLQLPVDERIEIMKTRLENGCEAISGEPLPLSEIKDANSRKRMQAAANRGIRKRASRSNRRKNKASR